MRLIPPLSVWIDPEDPAVPAGTGPSQAVATFYLDKYEVTRKQWRLYRVASARDPTGVPEVPEDGADERLPMDHLAAADARGYCAWVGARLPREMEWEAAATAGHADFLFPWGPEDVPAKRNVNEDAGRLSGRLLPVGSFDASELGLYDLSGNVWEWCDEDAVLNAREMRMWGRSRFMGQVQRGGSAGLSPRAATTRNRMKLHPETRGLASGFRCAMTPAMTPGK